MTSAAESRAGAGDRVAPPCDVAIVGFGPVGAVAAGLLAGRGLRVFVCDRSREVYDRPRAIAIDHEALRVLQELGLADAAAAFTEPFTPSEYFGVDGRLIRRLTMTAPPHPLGHTPSNVFTQPKLDALLRAHMAALPTATVALGVDVVGVAQGDDAVTLDLAHDDGEATQLRARYVVACDGASSRVREAVGIGLDDLAFDEPWLVVDAIVNDRGLARLPATSVQYCEPDRPCSFIVGPGRHRRWEISLKEGEDPREAETPARTWQLLARWLTPDGGTLWRQASYRFHALVASRWRSGRVFLAGDAAHQQPPFLGQGMCQGIRDAANLSWKLAAVASGEVGSVAAERLLDSYGSERGAHVRELTARIKAIGRIIGERDPAQARARDAELLASCNGEVVDMPRQDVIPGLDAGLLATRASSGRGRMFPQPWTSTSAGQRHRLDDVAGHSWRLMLAGSAGAVEAPEQRALQRIGGTTVRLAARFDIEGVAAAWFDAHDCDAALVRPDHHVFGTARGGAARAALVAEVEAMLA